MEDITLVIVSCSVILQIISALLAIRLLLIPQRRTAGLIIMAAISLMAFRRLLSLYRLTVGGMTTDLSAEVTALIVSLLLLIGIFYFTRLIRSITKITESLANSEKRYQSLFDQSPDGILLIDEHGRIIDFNETAHRQLGYSRDEFAGLNLSDIDHAESPEEIKASIRKVADEGKAEFRVRHKTKSGGIRDVRVITRVIDLSGQRLFHTIWRDITEEARAEEARRESEKFLQMVIETAPT